MVIIKLQGLKMAEPLILSKSRQCTLAAQNFMEIIPNQLFYILVRNFSERKVQLSRHMKTAWAV